MLARKPNKSRSGCIQVAESDGMRSLMSAVDSGLKGQVHPPNKFELAKRLVRYLVLLLAMSALARCPFHARWFYLLAAPASDVYPGCIVL